MTEHPITPPPELVVKWVKSARYKDFMPYPEGYEQYEQRLTTIAARWGADMELEACCQVLYARYDIPNCIAPRMAEDMREWLRAARRPKSPSLKEQAMKLLRQHNDGWAPSPKDWDTIRQALEQLDD